MPVEDQPLVTNRLYRKLDIFLNTSLNNLFESLMSTTDWEVAFLQAAFRRASLTESKPITGVSSKSVWEKKSERARPPWGHLSSFFLVLICVHFIDPAAYSEWGGRGLVNCFSRFS